MIEKKQIQKMIAAILKHKNGLPDHQIMHPFREWVISLSVTMLLLGLMVISCIRLYQHYNDFTIDFENDESALTTTIIYRSEEVAAGIKNFEANKAHHEEILNNLERHKSIPVTDISPADLPSELQLASSTDPISNPTEEIPTPEVVPLATTTEPLPPILEAI